MCFVFLFFIIKTLHSTSEIHKCRVYFHQTKMGKSNQKVGKTVLKKVTQLVTRALVAIRKNKKLLKVKPQH